MAALGLAYKPDVDDLRESPAVEVVHLLQGEGANVLAYEPFKTDAKLPGISITPNLNAAIRDADALVLLVSHSEFLKLSPDSVAKITRARIAIDTVNGWDSSQWQSAGIRIVKLGSGKPGQAR
ncbi:MAG: hypothetical protein DYG86_11425 [Chloroflexi bacterium CFX2]|nr:hypothetical protein [Chloroflexi bacterium CFX2]